MSQAKEQMRSITPAVMTRPEAAVYLGVATATLEKWAKTGRYGLKFTRVGGAVRYRKADLDAWLEKRTVETTGEAEGLSQ